MEIIKVDKESEIERIIQTLVAAIAQRRLKPGQRIVEAKIVEILNANRNHVQVALKRMTLANIVHIERNKGAFVSQPSAKEARDVFAARRAVERGIVQLIAPDQMQAMQQELQAHMDEEREVITQCDRHKTVMVLSDFHRLLAKVSGNSVLAEVLDNLLVRSSIIEVLYSRNSVPACACGEHQQILTALQQGDKDTAIRLMLEHLDEIEEQLILNDEKEPEYDLAEALSGI